MEMLRNLTGRQTHVSLYMMHFNCPVFLSDLHSPIQLGLFLEASLGDSQQVLLQLANAVCGLRQPPPHLLPLLRQALRRAQQLLRDTGRPITAAETAG